MNTTASNVELGLHASGVAVETETALIFVDDAAYEFVGGGMAANGI